MLESFKEIAENVRDTGFDLAARAVTGFISLYREVALHVEEQTGFTLPMAGDTKQKDTRADLFSVTDTAKSPGGQSISSKTSPSTFKDPEQKISTIGADEGKEKSASLKKDEKKPQKKDERETKKSSGPVEKTEEKKSEKTTGKSKKTATKKRVTKKRATNKSGAQKKTPKKRGRKNQLVRVLEMLNEDAEAWISASELSKASAEHGSKILPGNVRKVIRMRGEPYIETRPRAKSRRGSLEYHITDEGLKYLEDL